MSDTQTLTIQGHQFSAPAPYAQGHVLTENEAKVMNQVLGENLRNNFAARVRAAREAAGLAADGELDTAQMDALQTEFNDYADKYEFAGKRSPRAPVDPVGREAHKIARGCVVEALQKNGYKVKDLPEGQLDELIEQTLSANAWIAEEASRRIATAKSVSLGAFTATKGAETATA